MCQDYANEATSNLRCKMSRVNGIEKFVAPKRVFNMMLLGSESVDSVLGNTFDHGFEKNFQNGSILNK